MSFERAARELERAAEARKCWRCGCLHHAVTAIEEGLPPDRRSAALTTSVDAARARLRPVEYDCLGCPECFPALAIEAVGEVAGTARFDAAACATNPVESREGWPPLPGSYTVVRYRAPVAVCTLTDERLARALLDPVPEGTAIVGTMQTENLGIERLVTNVVANPHIRFVVVCGADSERAVGHRPGASLVALARNGVGPHARIADAPGKRPILRNLDPRAVDHFRATVEVVDLVGEADLSRIARAVQACAKRDPGPAAPLALANRVVTERAYLPERMVPDPGGYFVVYVDRARETLALEHYRKDGALDALFTGRTAAELYTPAIARELLSRLDHAAYLGRELARAERSLTTGEPYTQDAAPERSRAPAREARCGCGPSACSCA